MLESPRHVRSLVDAKASAYLLKSDSSEHLIATVRAAVLDPEGGDAVVGMPPSMLGGTDKGEDGVLRSEEHTSELQSRQYLVCRLLLEKKKTPDQIRQH